MNYANILKTKITTNHQRIIIQRKNIIIKLQRLLKLTSSNCTFYINTSDKNSLFEENKFYQLINLGKIVIKEFITKYNIRNDLNIFDAILQDYQSFNYISLLNMNNYLYKMEKIYNVYNDFTPVFNFFEKLNNKLKENKMIDDDEYSDNIESFCSLFEGSVNKINLTFNEKCLVLEKRIKKLEEDNKKVTEELKNQKKNHEEFEKRIKILEDGFNLIKKELKCPITKKTFKNPVIGNSGITYEESSIKNKMIKKNNDSLNKSNSTNTSFYPNLALKNIISIVNKIKLD